MNVDFQSITLQNFKTFKDETFDFDAGLTFVRGRNKLDRIATHPEPDPAPFKVHLLTRAGRVMRARSEPVRAFSNKDEAVRFAGRTINLTFIYTVMLRC
jgi:hypothetical protein